ncbi:hypothetical protein HPB49_015006 [Dermacentor silvarum]|uniref:Uncharacterized protein n=1 Tax=Dermacentor silvarum TaxID=543639 RepID=A0ACB8CL88_DERSI|nr:hypothetical protein HPB49_015006 [Dermacentor silvarum]
MMALEMQRQGNQQNWQMMKAMQETQKEFLGEVSTMMKETSSVVKDTLETMTKQTTEQANMHRETLTAMQNNTAAASRMNSETLLAVQQSMNETRKMNSETIKMITSSNSGKRRRHASSNITLEQQLRLYAAHSPKHFWTLSQKLSALFTMKAKVDALEGIITTVDAIEKSVQAMYDKYDEVMNQMKKQNSDIDFLRTRVKKLEEHAAEQEIDKLKQDMNDLDQYK